MKILNNKLKILKLSIILLISITIIIILNSNIKLFQSDDYIFLKIFQKINNENKIDYNQDIIVALDDIQDPGNLGTILRTVDSVGLKQILVSKGTADSFNPKVVRSTMGAIFRVKIIECENLSETLKQVNINMK